MLRVADVMSTGLITLRPIDSLYTARTLMQESRIRHLPVVSTDGAFLGVISQRDLLKASVSQFADVHQDVREQIESGIPVSEVMTVDLLHASPDTPLVEAATTLLRHKVGCLPILEDDNLVGILTEADFVKLAIRLLGPT
jgi:CBS domain-containing membrane protein